LLDDQTTSLLNRLTQECAKGIKSLLAPSTNTGARKLVSCAMYWQAAYKLRLEISLLAASTAVALLQWLFGERAVVMFTNWLLKKKA
jgi:hypothetical protein